MKSRTKSPASSRALSSMSMVEGVSTAGAESRAGWKIAIRVICPMNLRPGIPVERR
jgi:hypothetical protein